MKTFDNNHFTFMLLEVSEDEDNEGKAKTTKQFSSMQRIAKQGSKLYHSTT